MIIELLLLVAIILFIIWHSEKKPSNLPPGEWGLSIFGHLPPSDTGFNPHLKSLHKKYGKLFCVRLGRIVNVVVCQFEDVKYLFSKAEASDRYPTYSAGLFSLFEYNGITFSSGKIWEKNRKFALTHLKDFGMGKTYFQDVVAGEAVKLVEVLSKNAGHPFDVENFINLSVINIIWQLLASSRYEQEDDERILIFTKGIPENLEILQGPLFLLDIYPVLAKFLPQFIKDSWMRQKTLDKNQNRFREIMKKDIEKHRETIDYNSPRDFIDALLIRQSEMKDMENYDYSAEVRIMITILTDLFSAGLDPTGTTIRWFLLYVAAYPEVQQKLHEEIDKILPDRTMPTIEDKQKLPYLEASIFELLRITSLTPTTPAHMANEDIRIGEYIIPKGTSILAFNEIIHRDSKYFEKPNEFYPEHFLDEEGRVITKKEGFMAFSLGKRKCVGETLAKMELFIFLALILQRFTIKPPAGKIPSLEPIPSIAFINYPKPFELVFTERK